MHSLRPMTLACIFDGVHGALKQAGPANVVLFCAGLGEIFDLRDKAVVISCMHVFCLACLSRWSSLKKSCPLCKVRSHPFPVPCRVLTVALFAWNTLNFYEALRFACDTFSFLSAAIRWDMKSCDSV